MKRFITTLALLAMMTWLGCEKLDGPSSPSPQQQQTKPTDDYPTIQEAVDNAAPGTKILVKDGTYTEEVSIFTDNLTITAAHEGEAHVIGGFGFLGVTKGTLFGFEIKGTFEDIDFPGGVFLVECTKVEIKDNEVSGTIDAPGFGIVLFASENCVVKDNKLHDNAFEFIFFGGGITIFFGGKHLVKGNICETNFIGITVLGGLDGDVGPSPGKNAISFNECSGNLAGIVLFGSHENTLGDNKCNDNFEFGIFAEDSDRNKIGSNNQAKDNGDIGIVLADDSDNNTVTKNTAKDNTNCDVIDEGTDNTFIKNNFGTFNCP